MAARGTGIGNNSIGNNSNSHLRGGAMIMAANVDSFYVEEAEQYMTPMIRFSWDRRASMRAGCWKALLLHLPLLKRNKSEAVTSVQYIVNSID
eukprot:scaffold842_cov287-Chaetoceros_neogracile.AAC.8